MRDALTLRAIHILALVCVSVLNGSCDPCDSSLDPVKCSDLCEQPRPHEDCAKCTNSTSRDLSCPQCDEPNPLPGCPNYDADASVLDASTDGAIDGDVMSGGAGGIGGGGAGGVGGVVGGMGGDSGTAGDAGDPGLICASHDDCPPAQAVCGEDNRCGACTHSDDCTLHPTALMCDVEANRETTGRCVDCLNDDECSSANAKQCVLGFCVRCEFHSECQSDETPECSAAFDCKACTDDEACVGRGARSRCDDRMTSDNYGECVECETHEDCEDETKPQCDLGGTCVPCTHNGACTDRTDGAIAIPYCNTRADATTFGQCVQCTGATEGDACENNKSCRQDDGRCTDTTIGSVTLCGTCEADSECGSGTACVALTGDQPGNFCMWRYSSNSGCADDMHLSARPFSVPAELTSVDGSSDDYCLPPTTYQAYVDAVAGKMCDTYLDCGATDVEDDGQCLVGGSAAESCSYYCDFDYECPDDLPRCNTFCLPPP